VAVLDHSMGNLRSVAKALEAAGATVEVTSDPHVIDKCDGLCVPGQGIFGRCMTALGGGLDDLIREWISADRPFLGICLGMQVLFGHGEESDVAGLGLIEGNVTRIVGDVTVPHIGWNTVGTLDDQDHPPTYFYFDHSYIVRPLDPAVVTGWTEHGDRFAASLSWGSVTATQFHPEKSGDAGISLLKGWVAA
jgi:imidazole glycerol-phosphate synthase subunit HisH